MNPQPGEYWKSRGGRLFGPLVEGGGPLYQLTDGSGATWTRDGKWYVTRLARHEYDLIEKVDARDFAPDPVNHPKHYTSHPAGIECIQVTEHMNFNLGNVVKYVWRFDDKGGVQDLKKAAWYLQREIERLERDNGR